MATKVTLGLAILLLNPLGSLAHIDPLHLKRSHHDHILNARQFASGSSSTSFSFSSSTSVSSSSSTSVGAAASAIPVPSAVSGSGSASLPLSTLTATDPRIPPLNAITSGMASQATPTLSVLYTAGASPPVAGAPPLPTTTLDRSKYPAPTQLAPTDTPLVQEWLKELDGIEIPDIPPTKDQALCSSNPEAAADSTRCWWTCGGCTRSTDIVTCPNKMDWGLSFDDGPSPYTPNLLDYLHNQSLTSTFFAVGASVYWRPEVLQAEYMAGHQIAVHTWHHSPSTTLSNLQLVAEFGYSREIIKDVIGVTPRHIRFPYGDVDDRVRTIAMAMGLESIIWTRDPVTQEQYDTNDWKIPDGESSGIGSYAQFQTILTNATDLNTGFIVLEHDLYQQTVDLAVGYTLPSALMHQPRFSLKSINQCLGLPSSEVYQETRSNKTRGTVPTTWNGPFTRGVSSTTNSSSGSNSSSSAGANGTAGNGSSSTSYVNRAKLSAGILVAFTLLTTLLA